MKKQVSIHVHFGSVARIWRQKNNNGEGFPVGDPSDNIDELEGVDGLVKLLKHSETTGPEEGVVLYPSIRGFSVYLHRDGYTVIVADSNGPWAVRN